MSGNHAWRTGSGHVVTRIGAAMLLTGALSTITVASQRETERSPIVLAAATHAALPAISDDADLVNISPLLEPAPDIFDGKGLAEWDGRRTLRGIWVAHPMAQTARRVRIYNLSNGAVVDGALFKKDAVKTDNAVIISSDAADKLGLEPDVSAQLRIVAVRLAAKPEGEEAPTSSPRTAEKAAPEDAGPTDAERKTVDAPATETETKTTDTKTSEDAPKLAIAPEMSGERKPGGPPIPRARPGTSLAIGGGSGAGIGDRTGIYPSAAARAAAGFKFVPDGEGETVTAGTKSYFKSAPAPKAEEEPAEPTKVARVDPIAPVEKTVEEPTVKLAMATEATTDPVAGAVKAPAAASNLVLPPAAPVKTAASGAGEIPRTPARMVAAPEPTPARPETRPSEPVQVRSKKPETPEKPDATFKLTATPDSAAVEPETPPSEPVQVRSEKPETPVKPDATLKLVATPDSTTDKPETPPSEPVQVRSDKPKKAEKPDATFKLSAAPDDATTKAPTTSGKLAKPYVQAGFFGVEGNAKRLVERLKSKGIPAITRAMKAGDKDFLRVLAGPFADAAAREKAQTKIRAMGLKDAMPVKG